MSKTKGDQTRLSESENVTLVLAISEFDYACGVSALPVTASMSKPEKCRNGLSCALPFKNRYYFSGAVGPLGIHVDHMLKHVLPISDGYAGLGKKAMVYRPFGKHA